MIADAHQTNELFITRPSRPSSPFRPSRKHDEGVALFFVLMAIAVLATVTSAFTAGVHRHLKMQNLRENEAIARYLAEAGAEIAAAKLGDASAEYRGETDTPFGSGRFSVEVKLQEGGAVHLRSTGVYLSGGRSIAQVTIESTLRRDGTRWISLDRHYASGRPGFIQHE